MRSDELIAAVQLNATIEDGHEDYGVWALLKELNAKLSSVFEDVVTKARAGYWLKHVTVVTQAGQARYRIPPRACVGGLESVELAVTVGGRFRALDEVPNTDVPTYQGTDKQPHSFTCFGDTVLLLPTPNQAFPLRLNYYLRPSRVLTSQSSVTGVVMGSDNVVRGRVDAVDPALRTIEVNVIPFDQLLATPAAITSQLQTIDVVRPDGWHEVVLIGAPQTFVGTTITVGGDQDMGDIQVGDFVRVAGQTDWPCLPEDFHQALADVASIKICLQRDMAAKSTSLAENTQGDLLRFRSMLLPRVKSQPKEIPFTLRGRS